MALTTYRFNWSLHPEVTNYLMFALIRNEGQTGTSEPVNVKAWAVNDPETVWEVDIINTPRVYLDSENIYFYFPTGKFDGTYSTYTDNVAGQFGNGDTSIDFISDTFIPSLPPETELTFEVTLSPVAWQRIRLRQTDTPAGGVTYTDNSYHPANMDPWVPGPPILPSIPEGRYKVEGEGEATNTISVTFDEEYGTTKNSIVAFKIYNIDSPELAYKINAIIPDNFAGPLDITISEEGDVTSTGDTSVVTSGTLSTGPMVVEFSSTTFKGWKTLVINDVVTEVQELEASPVIPPVLYDITAEVDYEGSRVINVLENANPGEGVWDYSSLKIKVSENWVDALDLAGIFVSTANDGTIGVVAESGFEGSVEPFEFTIANDSGGSTSAKVNITVSEEPPLPPLPIIPLTDVRWVLGSFRTGELEDYTIPYISDSIAVDVNGDDEADLSIPLYALSNEDRKNFRTKFEINEKMAALIDGDNNVVFAGYIEKLAPSLKEETLDLKVKGFKAWLKTRFVTNSKDSISSSEDVWTLTASPRTVAKNLVSAVLSGPNNPQSVQYPASKAGAFTAEYVLSELVPVSDAIDNISTALDGAEIKFRPKLVGNRIVFEMLAGSPHIGDSGTADVVINLDDPEMIAVGFDQIDDGSEVYNKVWLESDFANKEGASINLASRSVPSNKLIREKKEKLEAELTTSQLDTQYQARLEDANKTDRQNTLTIWDDNYSFFFSLGRRIQLIGSGRSDGMDDIVRVIGVKFSTKQRTMDLTVSNIKRVYPPLPKSLSQRLQDDAQKAMDDRLAWDRSIGNGGGTGGTGENPWNPGEGESGEWNNGDLWGAEGQPTDGSAPVKVVDGIFSSYTARVMTSDYSFVAGTITQNSGNRIFALGRSSYHQAANQTNYDGAVISDSEGLPIGGFEPIPIYKSFVQNGSTGEWTVAGYITSSAFRKIAVDTSGDVVHRGFALNQFILGNRLWVNIVDSVRLRTGEVRSKASFIYTEIDSVGGVGFTWTDLGSNPSNLFIPPAFMTRFGDKLIFTSAISFPRSSPSGYVVGEYDVGIGTGLLQKQTMIFIPSAIEKWVPIPPVDSGNQDVFFLPTNYAGWLYVVPGRGYLENPEIMRIRLSPSGFISPEAKWESVGKNQTVEGNQTMGTVRGYILYNYTDPDDRYRGVFKYRKVLGDGALGSEEVSGLPIFRESLDSPSSYFYSAPSDAPSYWGMKEPYQQGSSPNQGVAQSSGVISYGGYIYRFVHQMNGGMPEEFPPIIIKSARIVEKTNQII